MMSESIPDRLLAAVESGRTVVWTSLVETRGSTPQKAGAAMLVFENGEQVGTLGGGCVEAEVKRTALLACNENPDPRLLTFDLDNDYGWDDGLICGGRMRVLVDIVRPESDRSFYQQLAKHDVAGCTEAVLLRSHDEAGCLEADRFLFSADGTPAARKTRAGDANPESIAAALRPLNRRPRPYVVDGVSYLPRLTRCRLVIVGAGHVGQRVAELAADVDFDVCVVDDRAEYCSADRFPRAVERITGPIEATLADLSTDESTFCIIVTRGHHHDEQALFRLIDKPARYLGMIGSRRKIRLIFADLTREGISRELLARVRAPLGIDIGSQTVNEIAVSIVAELIAHRNLAEVPDAIRRPSLAESLPAES